MLDLNRRVRFNNDGLTGKVLEDNLVALTLIDIAIKLIGYVYIHKTIFQMSKDQGQAHKHATQHLHIPFDRWFKASEGKLTRAIFQGHCDSVTRTRRTGESQDERNTNNFHGCRRQTRGKSLRMIKKISPKIMCVSFVVK